MLRPNWPNATLSDREFSEFACLGRECVKLGFDVTIQLTRMAEGQVDDLEMRG